MSQQYQGGGRGGGGRRGGRGGGRGNSNYHNPNNGNPYVVPGGTAGGTPSMGAWQPTAPTQMVATTAAGPGQQGGAQGGSHRPGNQMPASSTPQPPQPYPSQGYPPGTGMNPYAMYNPYAAAYPGGPPPMAGGGQGGGAGNPRGGWTPTYPPGGNPYASAQGAGMYYNPQQQPMPGRMPSVMQPAPSGNTAGNAAATATATPSVQPPPQPRVRKALVITDKNGNPIELPNANKSKTTGGNSSLQTEAAKSVKTNPTMSSTEAGEKLKQAALAAIQGKEGKKKEEKSSEEDTSKKEDVADGDPKKKKEEKPKIAETNSSDAVTSTRALTPSSAPSSSLATLLSKQENRKDQATVDDLSNKFAETSVASDTEASAVSSSVGATTGTVTTPSSAPSSSTFNGLKQPRRFVFSKNELLRLKQLPVCTKRPEDIPEFVITKEPSRRPGGDLSSSDNNRRDRRSSQQRSGGDWQRGAAPPRTKGPSGPGQGSSQSRNSNNEDAQPWARGQAPPPRAPQGGGRGGRGGGRGGRGGGPQYFDGPVEPLVKSKNGWRPQKNTSEFVVAEKKVKGILNKMTKEKFDRLSAQMAEIPITSYGILKMLIENVYEKAIDEPSFGDMYSDLCAKLSQNVQSTSFVKIIESDEEPPTDDGELAPASTSGEASSSYTVYRWSNDVSTSDSEIVGPFASKQECIDLALSSQNEQDPIERGDTELELVSLQIKNGVFVKVMKKKSNASKDSQEEGQVKEAEEFFAVYFPVADHEECGQQLSKIFLTERECFLDANKANSFKRLLLNKCEDEFNKQDIYVDWKKEKAEYEQKKSTLSTAEQAETEEELDFRRIKIKKQMLGNIKFIGQLYKKGLLKEKIMRFCIGSLLKLETKESSAKLPDYYDTGDMDMDEEDHEAICSMFTTIGKTIDRPPAANYMKVCFDKIKKMSSDKSLPSRSRFMYKDLIELRDNQWTPRRKEEKAKTLEEIRQDFERDEARQAQQSAQLNQGYRGGGAGGGRGSGDYRNQNRSSFGSNRNSRPSGRPSIQTDDDGFTTVGGGGGGGGSKSRGGAGGTSSLAQAASSPQRILQKPKQGGGFAALADDTNTSSSKPRPPSLDKEKFERRVKLILSEYMQDPTNTKELLFSMEELTGTTDYGMMLVSTLADMIIDCKDNQRKATYEMLSLVVELKFLTPRDVQEGLADFIEFIDAYICDAPRAVEYLGDLLASMIRCNAVNVTWIGQQAEKTKANDDTIPEKIVRAVVKAITNDKRGGPDAVRQAFGTHQHAMESLLGPSKWADIKKDV